MIAVLLNSASIMWALSSFGSCLIAWQRALMRMARIWLSFGRMPQGLLSAPI
jgi:hypothetical protein